MPSTIVKRSGSRPHHHRFGISPRRLSPTNRTRTSSTCAHGHKLRCTSRRSARSSSTSRQKQQCLDNADDGAVRVPTASALAANPSESASNTNHPSIEDNLMVGKAAPVVNNGAPSTQAPSLLTKESLSEAMSEILHSSGFIPMLHLIIERQTQQQCKALVLEEQLQKIKEEQAQGHRVSPTRPFRQRIRSYSASPKHSPTPDLYPPSGSSAQKRPSSHRVKSPNKTPRRTRKTKSSGMSHNLNADPLDCSVGCQTALSFLATHPQPRFSRPKFTRVQSKQSISSTVAEAAFPIVDPPAPCPETVLMTTPTSYYHQHYVGHDRQEGNAMSLVTQDYETSQPPQPLHHSKRKTELLLLNELLTQSRRYSDEQRQSIHLLKCYLANLAAPSSHSFD